MGVLGSEGSMRLFVILCFWVYLVAIVQLTDLSGKWSIQFPQVVIDEYCENFREEDPEVRVDVDAKNEVDGELCTNSAKMLVYMGNYVQTKRPDLYSKMIAWIKKVVDEQILRDEHFNLGVVDQSSLQKFLNSWTTKARQEGKDSTEWYDFAVSDYLSSQPLWSSLVLSIMALLAVAAERHRLHSRGAQLMAEDVNAQALGAQRSTDHLMTICWNYTRFVAKNAFLLGMVIVGVVDNMQVRFFDCVENGEWDNAYLLLTHPQRTIWHYVGAYSAFLMLIMFIVFELAEIGFTFLLRWRRYQHTRFGFCSWLPFCNIIVVAVLIFYFLATRLIYFMAGDCLHEWVFVATAQFLYAILPWVQESLVISALDVDIESSESESEEGARVPMYLEVQAQSPRNQPHETLHQALQRGTVDIVLDQVREIQVACQKLLDPTWWDSPHSSIAVVKCSYQVAAILFVLLLSVGMRTYWKYDMARKSQFL